MARPDRLTGLDASFLHLERDSAHMHVGGVLVFDGREPTHEQLIEQIESRLHLVPRYRQRLAFVPLQQGFIHVFPNDPKATKTKLFLDIDPGRIRVVRYCRAPLPVRPADATHVSILSFAYSVAGSGWRVSE